ncbi:uncharacterized protein N7483_000385 [Penicillium malachiteum]|uniref:uncharacterized protein n=1 Tax=Penicillium malachiteum TaxID=1324776 RepID=UPI002548EF99|nr:uncharacterized protein N7483_000385 [Penicillium malachiteum]KAJ5735260.1 hypothetical protein N7483_000385 [Penicillium malachiteum]
MGHSTEPIHIAGLPSHRHLHSEDPLALIFPHSGPSALSFPVLALSLPHRFFPFLHPPSNPPRLLACGFSSLPSPSPPDPCFNLAVHSTRVCSALGPAPSADTFLYTPRYSSTGTSRAPRNKEPWLLRYESRKALGETEDRHETRTSSICPG